MKSERISAMLQNGIAMDSETALIGPGMLAPDVVLGSAAEMSPSGLNGAILDKRQLRSLFRSILADSKYTIIVANGPFDFLVLAVDAAKQGEDLIPAIFNMYDPEGTIVRGYCDGRVFDIQRAEELHAIAGGHLGKNPYSGSTLTHPLTGEQAGYSLDMVTWSVQNRCDAKINDHFRMRYWEFNDVPLDQLPYEARQYPIDDAVNTGGDGLAQAGHLPSAGVHEWAGDPLTCKHCQIKLMPDVGTACMRVRQRRNLHDLARQTYAHWAFHLSDSWGFNVDQSVVDELEKNFDERYERLSKPFIEGGLLRENGSENQSILKKKIAQAYGARSHCPVCDNTGKVPSPKTNGKTRINCEACNGTGLQLPPEVPVSDKGNIGTSADVLNESGDEELIAYGELGEQDKIKSTYIPLMRRARVCAYCHKQVGARIKKKNVEHAEDCKTRIENQGGEYTLSEQWRSVPLNARTRPLVETGRCAIGDGLHGLPRKGGVREAFCARPGYVLSSEDYTAGELVMHSENAIRIVGYSRMGDALNLGLDAHVAIAATMLGIGYEEAIKRYKAGDRVLKDTRQGGKAGNFGYLGGMGELKFTLSKRADKDIFTPCENGPDVNEKGIRGYTGLRPCILLDGHDRCGGPGDKVTEYKGQDTKPVCIHCVLASKRIREAFFRQWPENNHKDGYFAKINEFLENGQPISEEQRARLHTQEYIWNNGKWTTRPGEIMHHNSLRIRGGVGFTDGANGLFQGLLAEAAKNAYAQIQRECYDATWRVRSSEHMTSPYAGAQSPLYGSRAWMLAHDETVAEHPESVAHDAAHRAAEIMIEAERFQAPHMTKACKVAPCLMRRLYKNAEAVHDGNGRLIPWEPS